MRVGLSPIRKKADKLRKSKYTSNQGMFSSFMKTFRLFACLLIVFVIGMLSIPDKTILNLVSMSASFHSQVTSLLRGSQSGHTSTTAVSHVAALLKVKPKSKRSGRIISKNDRIYQKPIGSNATAVSIPKLLYMAPSYSLDQFACLKKSLSTVTDICNSGWNITIHLQTANNLGPTSAEFVELHSLLYCDFMEDYIPFLTESYGKIGFGLNSRHRLVISRYLEDFDFFVYAEEDMLLTPALLNNYLAATMKLKTYLPKTWYRYYVGFLRYEENKKGGGKITWEYPEDQTYAVNLGDQLGHYLVTLNMNQAIFILSRSHIKDLERRCGFLSDIGGRAQFYMELRRAMNRKWNGVAVGVSEWSSSYQHILQCGMRRIIPANNTEGFLIYHSTNKGQSRRTKDEFLTPSDWERVAREKIETAVDLNLVYDKIVSCT
jgi:hypothetical protein